MWQTFKEAWGLATFRKNVDKKSNTFLIRDDRKALFSYSFNNVTKRWIQISHQNWNGFFSNITQLIWKRSLKEGKIRAFFIHMKCSLIWFRVLIKILRKCCMMLAAPPTLDYFDNFLISFFIIWGKPF